MRLNGRLLGVMCLAWLGALGCAGRKERESQGPLPRERYATEMAEAVCASRAPCCKGEKIAYDHATCVDNERALYEAQLRSFARDVAYDEDAAGRCLDALRSRGCDALPPGDDYPGCAEIWQPSLEVGSSCRQHEACSSGECTSSVCVGPPSPAPPAGEGEPCASDCLTDGNGGYSCFLSRPVAPAEGGCYIDQGLFCAVDFQAGEPYSGTCQRIPSVGEDCVVWCEEGAICGPGDVCRQLIDSGPCLTTRSICSDSTFCRETVLTTHMGVCEPKLPDGEACRDLTQCESGGCSGAEGQTTCGFGSIATPETCRGL